MTDSHLEYASRIPKEVRMAVDSLSGQNDLRYAIIMVLIEHNDLQFSELQDRLGVHQQTLTNALQDMRVGGLIEKKPGEKIGDQTTGAYTQTVFGDRIVKSLYNASNPDTEIKIKQDTDDLMEEFEKFPDISAINLTNQSRIENIDVEQDTDDLIEEVEESLDITTKESTNQSKRVINHKLSSEERIVSNETPTSDQETIQYESYYNQTETNQRDNKDADSSTNNALG